MQALRVVSTTDLERDDWLQVRRQGLGGSDIAAIAGLNPWKSPMAVYLDKINELPEQPDNERMYWGRVLEDVVAREFQSRTSHRVQRVNAVLQHPKYHMLLANIDRKVFDGKGNGVLEIKTTGAWNAKEWEEKVPDWVMVQLQHYLGVTGLRHGYVAALIGGNQYIQYEIPRDDEVIGYLQKIALDFWKLVENKTPPEIDGSQASADVLDMLYPQSAKGQEVMLPSSALELIAEYEQAKADEKAAKERKDAAANKIKLLMGEGETGKVGNRVATWKSYNRTDLDSKKLKTDMPDIWERYATSSSQRRFLIKKEG